MTTILVIDDEVGWRKIICARLRENATNWVVEASSGNEAIALLSVYPRFDIIISDYAMPDGNGKDLFDFIVENSIKTKFILFSETKQIDLSAFSGEQFRETVHKSEVDKLIVFIETNG